VEEDPTHLELEINDQAGYSPRGAIRGSAHSAALFSQGGESAMWIRLETWCKDLRYGTRMLLNNLSHRSPC
jgi:hypothetical protein